MYVPPACITQKTVKYNIQVTVLAITSTMLAVHHVVLNAMFDTLWIVLWITERQMACTPEGM